MYTLKTLIKEFDVEEGSILKMDCEGCEYEVIPHTSPDDLDIFSQIIVEYHNRLLRDKKALESAGFATEIRPIRSVVIPIEKQGYVVAKRS